jgi:hypothetical protein
MRADMLRRNSFGLVMLLWFAGSLVAQYVLSVAEGESLTEFGRSVAENWQSEALQLLFQVVGLRFLLQVGSPSSKEASERLEAKIDAILADTVRDGDDLIQRIDREYMRNQ